jgi:hypothetical protein
MRIVLLGAALALLSFAATPARAGRPDPDPRTDAPQGATPELRRGAPVRPGAGSGPLNHAYAPQPMHLVPLR